MLFEVSCLERLFILRPWIDYNDFDAVRAHGEESPTS
jgi:hypothetical protein